MPCLSLHIEDQERRLVPLDKQIFFIGRSPQADLVIEDARASRRHARICRNAEGYILEDLKSRNGTIVNGRLVTSPKQLRAGDRIEIGGLSAVFDPQGATQVSLVDETASGRIGESSSSVVQLGDEGTLLRFSPEESLALGRRDPMVRLKIIYHFADCMRRCFLLDELLSCILDGLFEVLTPDRAAVLLTDRKSGRVESAASRTRDQLKVGSIPISSTIMEKAIASRTPIIARDIRSDRRFDASESIVASQIGTAVCIPMISGDEVCGLLYLDFLFRRRPLEDDDLDLLAGLANQSAMAIGNALHHSEEVERREMEMQLGVARRVHDRLLSHTEYEVDGIVVRSINRPSKTVGGDYLGVLPTGGGVLLAIADGTGHGIGAALLMSTARAYLVALLEDGSRPLVDAVSRLNRLLCEDVDPGLFVSLELHRIDRRTRRFSGVCAGHEPPLLYRCAERRFLELPTGGTVLGLDPESTYAPVPEVQLLPGDRIVLFTDGIVEQLDAREQEFGLQRLRETIAAAGEAKAEELLAAIIHAVDRWRGIAEQGDDYSLMVVEIQ